MPAHELCLPAVQGMLKLRAIEVLLAVTPTSLASLPGVIKSFGDAELRLGLWPMLDDTQGRWGSTFNAQDYGKFVLQVAQLARPGTTMALDLEPPIDLVRRLLRAQPSALSELFSAGGRERGLSDLQALASTLRARGFPLLAAAPPLVLADGHGSPAWQWLLGTPFAELPFDVLSFMSYTSLLEGYSSGLLPRSAAVSLHATSTRRARAIFAARASISLGVVGGGALGDERPYRHVEELREDVAVARFHGVDDLGLFGLSGVLSQAHPESWLDTFVSTEAGAHQGHSKRSRLLVAATRGLSEGIRLYRRFHGQGRSRGA